MSYLNRTRDPRRNAQAIVAVGAVHAVLAYGLLTGLTVADIEKFVDGPFVGTQIPLPPPPEPAPEPTEKIETPQDQKPVAPASDFEFPTESAVEYETFDASKARGDEISLGAGGGDETILPPPPPPPPAFTPTGARPIGSPSRWISTDDYPRRPLIDAIEGTVGYRLIVGSTGRVSACEVTASSGNAQLDAATCRLITRRARFEPATDGNGTQVVGNYSGTVRWEIPD